MDSLSLFLYADDLWDALSEYPEAKKMLLEKGKQILMKVGHIIGQIFPHTECHKIYRKSVLHVLKYWFAVYLSTCA